MPVRKSLLLIITLLLILQAMHISAEPQIIIRPPAQAEIILAVPDTQPKTGEHAAELSGPLKTFNQVLWDDLKFSGYFTMAGKSFYPPQPIVRPEDVNYDAWKGLPFEVGFMTAGTLDLVGGILTAELRVYDMKQRTTAFGQIIRGDTDQVRSIAHRWADEIVFKLTAGASRGIASTRIAFSSRRGAAKEIYIMDYDGNAPVAFTHNNTINLFPMWAPDNSKLVFVSFRTGRPEINIHSAVDGSRLPFPILNSFASTPAISPDGKKLLFSHTTERGDTDLFISNLDGSDRQNVTSHPGIDSSPAWSPSGRQFAFISNRHGIPQLYIADSDGGNVRRIVKEGGDADSPSWSPDGRWIAFHWKPRESTNYDIYMVEAGSGKIVQSTTGPGSNESPSWAPDSRHITFQSNRTGSSQIYIMLADGTELRMVSSQGTNTSPSWGSYAR
jgi:TolB protein